MEWKRVVGNRQGQSIGKLKSGIDVEKKVAFFVAGTADDDAAAEGNADRLQQLG